MLAHHLEKQIIPHWLRKERAKAFDTKPASAAQKSRLNQLAHQVETKACGKRFAKMCKRGRAVSTTVCRAAALSYKTPGYHLSKSATKTTRTHEGPDLFRSAPPAPVAVDLATAVGAECKIEHTFLMAWVRHPWQRCWQEYHDLIQRKGGMVNAATAGNGATLPTYAEFAHDLCAGSRSFQFLAPSSAFHVPQVVGSFHFIGVAERHDESVVALALLLGVSPSDLGKPHWWAKAANATKYKIATDDSHKSIFDNINYADNGTAGIPIDGGAVGAIGVGADDPQPSLDYNLYTASNTALDNLIEELGRRRFEDALKLYQKIPQQVTKTGRVINMRRRRR